MSHPPVAGRAIIRRLPTEVQVHAGDPQVVQGHVICAEPANSHLHDVTVGVMICIKRGAISAS